jgi:transcriptional regulator with XRE-family HTH domain
MDNIIERIEIKRIQMKLSLQDFCKASSLTTNGYRKILSGDTSPKLSTLRNMLKTVNHELLMYERY